MNCVSKNNDFLDLVKNKKIIIPIIQRDYAQGRNDQKAIVVRTRLIDEWIDVLKDEKQELRMDFNYIYGNGDDSVFYPVDGQQRLTSLFLLHWYLARATNNSKEISDWQFDYKTRNSASEFFAFLREPEKSVKLFEILNKNSKEEDKQLSIRNESWFKTKWEHDPTVVSCINFLCMLASKLSKYKDQFGSFWSRLTDEKCPAVYFTCLNECGNETDAAKKYTRMNARGKRLTDFENLKAMIDEIEMKHTSELTYCNDSSQEKASDTISWKYDSLYIDRLYQSLKENYHYLEENCRLLETTKAINNESEKWFKLVYYIYSLKYKCELPSIAITENNNKSYEDIIYKISQGRVKDDNIVDYLYMMKAIFEVLCNSGDKVTYRYDEFIITDTQKRRNAIAFVLFVSGLWNKNNESADNAKLIKKWNQFKNMLDDLNFQNWQNGDSDIASTILNMVDGIKKTSSKSVDEYFISNDFVSNDPFSKNIFLPDIDIKCRIIERKIKSKLIHDEVITEESINKISLQGRRWGYLYYICGYLEDWTLDDWSKKAPWNKTVITDYIDFISANGSIKQLMSSRVTKVVYAYASQYDTFNKCLNNSDEISKCNNEHIWNDSYLMWQDNEFGCLNETKKKQLNHLKTMIDLLLEHKAIKGTSYDKLIEEYAGVIKAYFDDNAGYETCWLRFAVQYEKGGKELLTSELKNDEGVVKIGNVPVILKTFLAENYQYIGDIDNTEKVRKRKNFDFNKTFTVFTANESKVLYSELSKTCTFLPYPDNLTKYQHSDPKKEWNLSGYNVSRNMDLYYRVYWDLSGIGETIKDNFFSIDISNGVYTIKIYEIDSINAGKLSVKVKEANIDENIIEQTKNSIENWNKRFIALLNSPKKTGNFNKWIELWYDDYKTAFDFDGLNTSLSQEEVTEYNHGGKTRPQKFWHKVWEVPNLIWKKSTVNI